MGEGGGGEGEGEEEGEEEPRQDSGGGGDPKVRKHVSDSLIYCAPEKFGLEK